MKGKKNPLFISGASARLIALLIVLTAILVSTGAWAHGPSQLTLSYAKDTGILSITIVHSVSNPATHYVKKVEISLNDRVEKTYTYDSQPDSKRFTYSYPIEAKPGDRIAVTVKCNYVGSNSATLTVEP